MQSQVRATDWISVLDANSRTQALSVMDAIIREIVSAINSPHVPLGLSGGLAGYSLALSCVSKTHLIELELDVHVRKAISLISNRLSEEDAILGLYGGITGIAWAHFLSTALLGDSVSEAVEYCADIDGTIMQVLSRRPWRQQYDLIGGLVGYGAYALAHPNQIFGRRMFADVQEHLLNLADLTESTASWITPTNLILNPFRRARYPNGYYDLGLAHGIPGVVALFARASTLGYGDDCTHDLLSKAINFILLQRTRTKNNALFPSVVNELEGSRLAWCYGDLGIACAIFSAGDATANTEWTALGLEIAAQGIERSVDESGVLDAALCHGACGVAHMYNCLFQATKQDLFKNAATLWFQRGLAMQCPKLNVGIFPRFDHIAGAWLSDSSVLTGSAGVLLALLAALGGSPPVWNRLFLLPLHQD